MTDNPEIRAKILDWQRRYNIQDGDPALALLELVQFVQPTSSAPSGQVTAKADVSSESLGEAMKGALLPVIERLSYQAQELQKRMDEINFDQFVKQIEGYHEGIDYCTKKLDVIKKESDAMIVKVNKASSQISPITRGAVLMLMAGAGALGYIVAVIIR